MAKTTTGFIKAEFEREIVYGKTKNDIKLTAGILADKIYECVVKDNFQDLKRLELQN